MISELVLDTEDLPLVESNDAPFYWPLSRADFMVFRDLIWDGFCSIQRDLRSVDDAEGWAAGSILPQIINEFLGAFQAAAVRVQTERDTKVLRASSWSRLEPMRRPIPAIVKQLYQGPPRQRYWRRSARALRHAFRSNAITLPLLPANPISDVFVTQSTPLTRCHAQLDSRRVVLVPRSSFFRPIMTPPSDANLSKRAASARDEWIAIIADAYADLEVPFDENAQAHHSWCFGVAFAAAKEHIERLLESREKLPRVLWTGTGGNVWDGLLRTGCRFVGGSVTGHDHAHGSGFLQSTVKEASDFRDCDEFVTYTQSQVAGLQRAVMPKRLIGPMPNLVDIESLKGRRRRPSHSIEHPVVSKGQIQKIMYVVGEWYADTSVMLPPLPDIVALDLQMRILHKLVGWGYEVVFKPHPESNASMPRAIQSIRGVSVARGRFEGLFGEADLVLFDWPMTTTLVSALSSAKPVVLIDLGLVSFDPQARNLLESRCALVEGNLDTRNRATLDWRNLREALNRAPSLKDMTFVKRYLGTS